uniref:DSBA-like thioredoxin domain-containing protein n=1 Tax=Craspedostauros australis TaxID=1486917 RepID=A0A7R9WT42_9STRA|mmetsp:Transcript_17232/g.47733  ORF Transcript_17232/g.47733 Transcript_17232/m.47733 type:complete len:164 (+) Transcript_17232:629-1120(+)
MASHRLIQMIGKRYGLDVSEAIYDRLNVYYFVDGHALNDRPLLAQAVADELEKTLAAKQENAESSNNDSDEPMTPEQLLEFLNGNEGREEIEGALSMLRELGVHGIPKFIIEGHTLVDGAAHSDFFVKIFREIESRGSLRNGAIFGNILGVSEEILERGSHSR